MRALLLLCAIAVVAPLTLARAESRRTLEEVALRKKPGEKEAVVARLPAGTPVAVLGLDGRWLLVRANGTTGYVTRTTVSEPVPGDGSPSQGAAGSAWSRGRKVDGRVVSELYVQVVAPRAALRATPGADGAPLAEIARGRRLAVIDAAGDPAWIHARDDAGHDGWIARAEVDNGASGVAVTGVDLAGVGLARETAGELAAPHRPSLRAELGIGFRALGMNLTSNAEGGLTNYVLDADAVAATVAVDVVPRLGGLGDRLVIAGDVRLSASDSSPGIDYPGPTAPAGKIPFRTLAVDLGVRAGVRVHRVFDLALRAGGHYDAFLADQVANAGMLPRERLLGATLGARADIAPDRSRFTITARIDALVLGGRKQSSGLEDGPTSTARALWGGLTMRYALLPHLAVFGGYDFSRASTEWTGMSVREPGATRTRRVDTAQLVQLGISTEL
ncbi:MAG TPA: SH3 domain-containing protein [Kofleriaceae bacterium]|nr:SH3 domain-containing protein [Kofleriaceae bacterium]